MNSERRTYIDNYRMTKMIVLHFIGTLNICFHFVKPELRHFLVEKQERKHP